MDAAQQVETYRFSDFELDLAAHQLRLRGQAVRLERRPFELLALLVSRHGKLVSREEIIRELWPKNVVIEFETGVNTLVRKVRHALGDSSDKPAFVETVAGVGYRFIAPVTRRPPEAPAPAEPLASATPPPRGRWHRSGVVAAVVLLGVVIVALQTWRASSRASMPISIAVLPFENLSRDDGLSYLAAGLAEDMQSSLAQVDLNNLRLVGSVSSQAFAASERPVTEIARELGVDYVVMSSLRAENNNIRVTSRLLRAVDNEQLWTASFDRELTSVLGLQRELSIAIAEQVRLRLSPDVAAAMSHRQTINPQAYDLFLRGRYNWGLLTPATSRQALAYYRQAIAADPEYALAWAGIAQVLSTAPITGDAEPSALTEQALDAVQRGLEYGAELSEVQYASGYFNYFLTWNWPLAEEAFRRAVALDPNSAIAHLMLGHVLSQTGNQVEARDMARRARELDPLFSHTFALSAQIAFQARDYPQALELARQAVAIYPESWIARLQVGQASFELGERDAALAMYESAERLSGGNSKPVAFRANALARMGRGAEARALLASLEARAVERYVPAYANAIIHEGLAEHDAAIDWLERAYAARDVHMVFLPVDPRWDALRGNPRFKALLERCGFRDVASI